MMRAALVGLCIAVASASAQPPMLAAGIDERPGAQVPLDVPFMTAGGTPTTLRAQLDGKQPVLLVLAYARCTMLCSLVLRGAAAAAHVLPREPGRDYRLILISLDGRETLDEAARKQATLLAELGRGEQPERWPYLVGTRANIDAVANALGFRYAWDARTEQYAHPAVLFVLTPDGRVARYLHGIEFAPDLVAGALDDAAAGRVLSTTAVDVLRCFRFDPASRRVGVRAQRFLQISAAAIFVLSFGSVALLVFWERRRRRRA
ncbi:MAG: SCO family protein [Kofleriaceae bacterium]|nr:SCO family protein [Kofleriaceae bacterium]